MNIKTSLKSIKYVVQILHKLYNFDMTGAQDIRHIINSIGGDETIASIYMALAMHGPQTISELARNAQIERTKIYRLLDEMQKLRLIEVELHPNRNIIKAASITSVAPIIAQKQLELKNAEAKLSYLEEVINKQTLTSPLTKVKFYRGHEGAKQMLWNQTKAETETLSFLFQNMQSHTGEDFFIRWAERCNQKGLTFRSLVGYEFINSQKKWKNSVSSGMLNNWQGKYIESSIHNIQYWTCIYDNVVAYFKWHEREIYGIEILNREIADANRSFFELLWKMGSDIRSRMEL